MFLGFEYGRLTGIFPPPVLQQIPDSALVYKLLAATRVNVIYKTRLLFHHTGIKLRYACTITSISNLYQEQVSVNRLPANFFQKKFHCAKRMHRSNPFLQYKQLAN